MQEFVDAHFWRAVGFNPITGRNDTRIMLLRAGDPGPTWFDAGRGVRGVSGDGTSYATW